MNENPMHFQQLITDLAALKKESRKATSVESEIPTDETEIRKLTEEWDQLLGSVYGSRLDKRLFWDGVFDRQELENLLSRILSEERRQQEDQIKEIWAKELVEAISHKEHSPPQGDVGSTSKSLPAENIHAILFGDIFLSLLEKEAKWLNEEFSGCEKSIFLSSKIQEDLILDLGKSLAQEATPTLYTEFNRRRPTEVLLEAHKTGRAAKGIYPSTFYKAFCLDIRLEIAELLSTYPALGWNLHLVIRYWRENAKKLISRINSDWREIQEHFELEQESLITAVSFGSGDRHAKGQSVAIIEISSEAKTRRLVYKPRDMSIDKAFNACLDLANKYDIPGRLRGYKTLAKSGYGYCEFIAHQPCHSDEEYRKFYLNFGRLTALLHCLGATDCHFENIIAHGIDPVLIDTETLFEPAFVNDIEIDKSYPSARVRERVEKSVMRTMIIPRWFYATKEYIAHEWTAAGVFGLPNANNLSAGWLAPNTDGMMPGNIEAAQQVPNSLPVAYGQENPLGGYTHEFITGFKLQIGSIMKNKKAWLQESGGILLLFRGVPRRLVFRPTSVYGKLLEDSRDPERCRSYIKVGLVYESMARACLIQKDRPSNWPIFHDECSQIFMRDIPFFWSTCDGREILNCDGNLVTSNYIIQPGIDCAEETIKSLTSQEIDFQIELINGAFVNRFGSENKGLRKLQKCRKNSGFLEEELIRALDTLSEKYEPIRILQHLLLTSIPSENALTWLGAIVGPDLKGLSFGIIDDTFALGTSGIGYFIHMCSATYPELGPWCDQLSLKASANLLAFLDQANSERIRKWWIDTPAGICGTGGGLHYFLSMSELGAIPHGTKWNSFKELSDELLEYVDICDLQKQPFDDIYSGLAGLIAPLMNLRSPKAIDLAVAIGMELVKRQQNDGYWKNNGIRRSGFGHGNAGIGAALAYLYGRTGEKAFRASCVKAINAEQGLKSDNGLGWRDLRYPKKDIYTEMWCQGAAGVAVSRLIMLENGISEQVVRDDLDTAIILLLNSADNGIDDLCCGSAGIRSTLRLIADWIDQNQSFSLGWHSKELREKILAMSEQEINGAIYRGHYRTMIANGNTELLSLMTGLAGIGISLIESKSAYLGVNRLLSGGMMFSDIERKGVVLKGHLEISK